MTVLCKSVRNFRQELGGNDDGYRGVRVGVVVVVDRLFSRRDELSVGTNEQSSGHLSLISISWLHYPQPFVIGVRHPIVSLQRG